MSYLWLRPLAATWRAFLRVRSWMIPAGVTSVRVDDPGWGDVGPNRARHRRLALWAYHRALERKGQQWGRAGYAAFRSGQLVGVAVTFASEAWPPPEPAPTLHSLWPARTAALRGWRERDHRASTRSAGHGGTQLNWCGEGL